MTLRHVGFCKACDKHPVVPRTAYCKACLSARRSAEGKRIRVRRALAGLCSRCEAPAKGSSAMCEKHLMDDRQYARKYRPEPKRIIRCGECGEVGHNIRTCPKNPDNAVT